MTRLDKERRLVANQVKKFERTAREIHEMADKLHKKMEQVHLETFATRERARTAREHAEAKSSDARKLIASRPRKAS